MDFLLHPTETLHYWYDWCRWAWKGPYRLGDPLLGTGEIRDQNRKLLREKWMAKEPKREDYGLPRRR